ncbi:MAG: hypothetical protein NVS2B2_36510 [Ktedonobacteraceae bacterium]
MKVKLPKDIVGVKFPKICTIEMNDFDIELFLPSLFFTILAQGRGKAKQTNDPTAIQKFIDLLAHHEALEGFDDVEGRRVLERLVRTTLITTGGVGRSSIGTNEQITSVVPYTLLAHKAGFPTKGRQRSVDTFVYQALRERIGADDALRDFVKRVFGKGIVVGSIPDLGGDYDRKTQLDILSRLSIAFLDGFEKTRPGVSREKNVQSPCPVLVKELATDIYRYLFEFYDSMPTQAFTHHLLILINFELFCYTLKLVQAINELVQNPEKLPAAMNNTLSISSPQIYIDFTGSPTGYSLDMARSCVRRDVETYQQFLTSNLLLRQLDMYVEKLKRNPRYNASIERKLQSLFSVGEYFQALLQLCDDPIIGMSIDAVADFDEDRIRKENIQEGEGSDKGALHWLDTLVNGAEGSVERVVSLLVEGQREEAIVHYFRWYWGVGGLKKPNGVLRGNFNRKSWRYAPTNDLLAVLVQLAAARHMPTGIQEEEGREVQPIRLQAFLQFLEERFGILVDRPPAQFEGAEYAAAARDNLRAMLRRLRQMGIFHDLSDDFTVQSLYPPYASKIAAKVEV